MTGLADRAARMVEVLTGPHPTLLDLGLPVDDLDSEDTSTVIALAVALMRERDPTGWRATCEWVVGACEETLALRHLYRCT